MGPDLPHSPVPCHPDQRGRPLALLEAGASAGLALFPDRYGYEFDDGRTVTRLDPLGSGERPAVPGGRTRGPVNRRRLPCCAAGQEARFPCRAVCLMWPGGPGLT
ncbi:DUF2332 family protein [Arthrobacter sp. NPDC056727]|uniref:DUF2332 family protein n=1 Tax=Arthrobacter sp. NPDC056727 TaxID=3345927 RepID=UPI00366CA9FE